MKNKIPNTFLKTVAVLKEVESKKSLISKKDIAKYLYCINGRVYKIFITFKRRKHGTDNDIPQEMNIFYNPSNSKKIIVDFIEIYD